MNSLTNRRMMALIMSMLAGTSGSAFAQDSVSTSPGTSDALNAYEHDAITQFVVDTVPLISSWGNEYRIAPLLKANADNDPLFTTQLLGSVAASPDHRVNLAFPLRDYRVWSTPGAGINPVRNTPGGVASVSTYSRQFGVGFSDFASVATNAVGALVGQDDDNPDRLYVTRTLAVNSRNSEFDDNTATVTLGAIDADGNLYLRADNFGSAGSQVVGENIVRVNLPARGNFLNSLYFDGFANAADQASACAFLVNNSTVTTNVPAALPQSVGGPIGIVLDFANNYRNNGGAGTMFHLAAGIASHRGNPSFSLVNTLGGVGTVASLARPTAGSLTNSINLFAVNATGSVVGTQGATLPTNITDGAGFTANTAGNAQFLQYLSQTTFRGGNGQVAVGLDPRTSTYIAAATATDPNGTEYIAVARFGGSVTWTVAAHEGKQVLDGPSGLPVGTIAPGASPISISAPAADTLGNIYFVAAFQPTVGPLTTALIKAVNTATGYRLERLLQAGQSFAGANSGRTYTIDRLTLGDSDSIASGSFFSANVIQPIFPGATVSDPASPMAFGGAIVNAKIIYNNGGTPEEYQAVLYVGPEVVLAPGFCLGDADGSGAVDFGDVASVLANFGSSYVPGSAGPGDANNDGNVNFSDMADILANFGTSCP